MNPVISLKQASLKFGRRALWEDLNLDINPGEFFAVLGPNGSGKTSFLKVLLGLQELHSGQASLGGHPVEVEERDQPQLEVGRGGHDDSRWPTMRGDPLTLVPTVEPLTTAPVAVDPL